MINRNVVLVCLSAVRADVFKEYNSHSVDALAPIRQVVGDMTALTCYSPSSWSGPVVASICTSLHPYMIDNVLDVRTWHKVRLPPKSLIDRFENSYCLTASACMQSVESYFDVFSLTCTLNTIDSKTASLKHGSRITRRLKKLVNVLKEPFLVYVHLMDAHCPESFDKPSFDASAYAGGVQSAVEHAAECLTYLQGFNPLVAIFADHGRAHVGEHGMKQDSYMYASSLYEELVKVPLFINHEVGVAGAVELRNLICILEAVSKEEKIPISDEIISQVVTLPHYGHEQLVSWLGGGRKLIYNIDSRVVESYHLGSDPHELRNEVTLENIPYESVKKLIPYVVPRIHAGRRYGRSV